MDELVRNYADKVMRDALLKEANLRDVVSAAAPALATGFDFARARHFPVRFLLPDGREREADLLFEVPYRSGELELIALICILIEHQTGADGRMALRTLVSIVQYWEKKWFEWEKLPVPRPEFRLPPVLPIVFHTGTKHWGSARTIADMLDEPAAFHQFAPQWTVPTIPKKPAPVDGLLAADQAFLQALAVVRVEGADREEFEKVFRATLKRLNVTVGTDRNRWAELIYLIVGWITHRRPAQERVELTEIAQEIAGEVQRGEEVRNMVQSYADVVFAKGIVEGERKGKLEGKLEGSAEQTRKLIVRLAGKRLGAADADVLAALNAIGDVDRLERIHGQSSEAVSWAELIAIE